ncbi:MAG TPA: VWA domain-containing protein, partial [Thermoanaerobaculia bacterium]|nr:VWA domain-containing protein [Thermoanaerobaculia bacterium]
MRPGFLLLLGVLALPLFAQQPALREKLEVRLIEVDAVVTDKEGNPVIGLGPDDFELYENRKRQTISNFSEYRETEETRASEAVSATTPARPEPRTIVFLIDTLQLRGNPRKSLFDSLRSLTARIMREGDRAHVLQWHDVGGISILAPQTTERTDIERALTTAETKVEGRVPEGPSIEEQAAWFRSLAETAGTPEAAAAAEAHIETSVRHGAEQDYAVMRRKTAAIQRILSSLTDSNRRTTFIYVSDNFPLIAGQRFFLGQRPADGSFAGQQPANSTQHMLEAIVRSANAHGIVFYALRPEIPNTVGQMGSMLEEQAVF